MSFETSPTLSAIGPALAKAQAEVEGAAKAKDNPQFRSKYADLSAVWDACRSALTSNGLSVVQSPGEIADGRMGMTTLLLHSSGEWMRGYLTIPLGKVDAQAYGSATTYARRYALAAFVGVAPEDDDGNAASAAAPQRTVQREEPKKPTLSDRADVFEEKLQVAKTADELRGTYGRGAKLCAELDSAMPERLVLINQTYETKLNELSERIAA